MLILPRRKWLLHKMLPSFLYGLYFLRWVSTAVCNSFFLPARTSIHSRPVHLFFPSPDGISPYWYMLRGCLLTGNLITPSPTCQFRPSLRQLTVLFVAPTLRLVFSPPNKHGSPDCRFDWKPMASKSLIHSWICITLSLSRTFLSCQREENLVAQLIVHILKGQWSMTALCFFWKITVLLDRKQQNASYYVSFMRCFKFWFKQALLTTLEFHWIALNVIYDYVLLSYL